MKHLQEGREQPVFVEIQSGHGSRIDGKLVGKIRDEIVGIRKELSGLDLNDRKGMRMSHQST